jgi:hypothetical protein
MERHPATAVPVGPKLVLQETAFPETNDVPRRSPGGRLRGYLGIDIGLRPPSMP